MAAKAAMRLFRCAVQEKTTAVPAESLWRLRPRPQSTGSLPWDPSAGWRFEGDPSKIKSNRLRNNPVKKKSWFKVGNVGNTSGFKVGDPRNSSEYEVHACKKRMRRLDGKDRNFYVCKLCAGSRPVVWHSSANFARHLRRKHADEM